MDNMEKLADPVELFGEELELVAAGCGGSCGRQQYHESGCGGNGGNINILSNDFNNNNVAVGVLSNILQV
jgi:hypothetical protein